MLDAAGFSDGCEGCRVQRWQSAVGLVRAPWAADSTPPLALISDPNLRPPLGPTTSPGTRYRPESDQASLKQRLLTLRGELILLLLSFERWWLRSIASGSVSTAPRRMRESGSVCAPSMVLGR